MTLSKEGAVLKRLKISWLLALTCLTGAHAPGRESELAGAAALPPHGAVSLRIASQKRAADESLNIVFIGDSITQGVFADGVVADDAPPVHAAAYLSKQRAGAKMEFSNQGRSGHTTVDVLPATQTDFLEIEQAATALQKAQPGRLMFSVMLGTNDSAMNGALGAPVSPQDYRKNLTTIIDRLLLDYPECKIILHRPIWYSPNTSYSDSRYLAEGLSRLQRYFPEIDALVAQYGRTHPRQVLKGDTEAFEFFKQNHRSYLFPEQGQQGTFYLHPNPKGAEILGRFWGAAIQAALRSRGGTEQTE
jgi:lysophospholipase L1-like esterase